MGVHQAFNNLYNEPPFAARVAELTPDVAVPAITHEDYVSTVVACAIGNPYGTCNAAEPDYNKMIEGFTPAEIDVLFSLLHKQTLISSASRTSVAAKRRSRECLNSSIRRVCRSKNKVEYDSYLT